MPPLATSDREYDFDAIAAVELMRRMPAARDDLFVDFDRNPPLAEPEFLQQLRHGERIADRLLFAIQKDTHGDNTTFRNKGNKMSIL